MPGLCGIIRRSDKAESKDQVQSMVQCMMHEKTYRSGIYLSDTAGIAVGWVCHKGSFSDCLPIWNEKKDICLVFIGEDIADESEIRGLASRAHAIGAEDASYLVHLYEEAGIDFIRKLNGCFSGMLMDFREGRYVLFNDRFGLNRLYYYHTDTTFYFSSEAKALLMILPGLRKLDCRGLGELFSCGGTLENRTLFPDISLLPGGSLWTFDTGGEVQKDTYFSPQEWENQPVLSESDYDKRLRETFAQILPRYFGGREKVAVSLTGGLDTRMIMAWAPLPPFKVPTYTFGGIYRDCADVKIARRVADICQQKHETIQVTRKFFSEFPALAKRSVYYSDGIMDVSGALELYMNRAARDIAPVRLTGNYGDQILRNTAGFKPSSLQDDVFDKEFLQLMKSGINTYYAHLSHDRPLSFMAFKALPWCASSRRSIEQTQLTTRSPYLDNNLVSLAYQAPTDAMQNTEFALRLIAEGDRPLSRVPTDRGLVSDPILFLSNVRHLYQDIAIKAEYLFDYGMPNWLSRVDRALTWFHPEQAFLGRHKFAHFRIWYRNELSKYVKDVLLDARTLSRPYLQKKSIEHIVDSHLSGYRNYTREIHWLLSSELIQRYLIEQH